MSTLDIPAAASRPTGDGNIDPAEVERFAALAARWWDLNGEFKPLHRLGPARIQFVRDAIERQLAPSATRVRALQGLRILDVGCGGGLVSEPLARLGGRVTAIDPGAETIAAARSHAAQQGLEIDYRVARIEEIVAAGETFDAVVSLEVVEHVPEPAAFLAQCARAVRPGGVIVSSTINRTMKAFALAIVGAEYVLGWLPRGTHQWERFVTLEEMRGFLERAGLEDVRFEGLIYDPLRDTWRLGADTDVNYLVSAVRPQP